MKVSIFLERVTRNSPTALNYVYGELNYYICGGAVAS